jgi:chromate reductase, NAD(P)H dehydrogenase (quinone)
MRAASTNTALLDAVATHAPMGITVSVYAGLADLPIFSPDIEGPPAPRAVELLANAIGEADGLIISCPEYVRALPGGFKNAIDWMVSRDEIASKPIALLHASHRGHDMLHSLRLVFGTVSSQFAGDIFESFNLVSKTPDEIAGICSEPDHVARIQSYLSRFAALVDARQSESRILT